MNYIRNFFRSEFWRTWINNAAIITIGTAVAGGLLLMLLVTIALAKAGMIFWAVVSGFTFFIIFITALTLLEII